MLLEIQTGKVSKCDNSNTSKVETAGHGSIRALLDVSHCQCPWGGTAGSFADIVLLLHDTYLTHTAFMRNEVK